MTANEISLPTAACQTGEFIYTAALDNHEPVRKEAHGILEEWVWPDTGEITYRLPEGTAKFKNVTQALFLLDDGRTVLPLYVIGWSAKQDKVFLGRFPVNVNEDGSPRMRADRDEQVDYSTWMLGPRRAYHLKANRI